jgi:hypothetical protein
MTPLEQRELPDSWVWWWPVTLPIVVLIIFVALICAGYFVLGRKLFALVTRYT